MTGYDKMVVLSDEFGADYILDSLIRSLSDGELDDSADFIARMLDFDFEGVDENEN